MTEYQGIASHGRTNRFSKTGGLSKFRLRDGALEQLKAARP